MFSVLSTLVLSLCPLSLSLSVVKGVGTAVEGGDGESVFRLSNDVLCLSLSLCDKSSPSVSLSGG